jgi:hypothetical protein
MAQALAMGDEMHMCNAAATARMIGAGIATPPAQPFADALVAFGAAYP